MSARDVHGHRQCSEGDRETVRHSARVTDLILLRLQVQAGSKLQYSMESSGGGKAVSRNGCSWCLAADGECLQVEYRRYAAVRPSASCMQSVS